MRKEPSRMDKRANTPSLKPSEKDSDNLLMSINKVISPFSMAY
jgi:hypothetical protein